MEPLNTYIVQARQSGQTDEQIRQALIAAGWNLEQVNSALGGISNPLQFAAESTNFNQPTADYHASDPNDIKIIHQSLAQPAPYVVTSQVSNFASEQNVPNKRSLKLPIAAAILVVLLLIVAGSVYALLGHKTSYQTVIQEFVTAMENKDKKTADLLESSTAKSFFQKNAKTTSIYDACQQVGKYCTASFSPSYLAKATKVYKDYTASNGTKGKELVYTIKESLSGAQSGGQGCSSNSTNTITIAAIPSGNSWLIDNLSQDTNASANLCIVPGGSSSGGNTGNQYADNTSRQQDAAIILSTIYEYISNNNGAFPQTASQGATPHALLICNTSCTSNNSSTANLVFYLASKVSFHTYASNLTVPDDETVYIVNKATCTKGTSIGAQTTGLSAAILYATQNGSGMKQECITS